VLAESTTQARSGATNATITKENISASSSRKIVKLRGVWKALQLSNFSRASLDERSFIGILHWQCLQPLLALLARRSETHEICAAQMWAGSGPPCRTFDITSTIEFGEYLLLE
jgi:hypothetical protein